MMKWKRIVSAAVCVCMAGMLITGCGSKSDSSSKKRIIRVALSQSEEHPEYKGMETFKKYVEEKLGDKYEVQLYPNMWKNDWEINTRYRSFQMNC